MNEGRGQTSLVNYSFEGSGLTGATNVTSASGINPTLTGSSTVTYNAGSTTSPTASACFASANGKYFELTLTTTGYSSITVDWNARTSSTTSSWVVTADDGGGYGSTLATQTLSTSFAAATTLNLGSTFSNKSTIKIKWTATVSATQTIRIDDILIKGTAQATSVISGTPTSSSIPTISCTNGTGTSRAVFIAAASSGAAAPVNGTTYTANTVFGSGTQGGTGWYCVFNNTGTPSVTVTGLSGSTTYRVMVCEYNGSGASSVYNTYASGTGNPANFTTASGCTEPTTQATTLVFSSVATTSMNIAFTRGNGDGGAIVVLRAGSAPSAAPTSGTSHTASTDFTSGSSSTIGSGKVVYYANDANPSFTVTNLTAGTTYYADVYEYNATDTCYKSSPLQSNRITVCSAPTANNASAVATTSFTANWSAATGATSYKLDVATDNGFTSLVSGFNDLTVNGISQSVTGLTAGTTYYYRVRAYNGTDISANSTTVTTATLATLPSVASAVVSSNRTTTTMDISWTNGTGANRIVVARLNATSAVAPTSATTYTPSATGSFTGSTTTGTGNIVIYNGSGSTVSVTNLSAGTAYAFDVYEYNGTNTTTNYSAAAGSGSTSTLATEPTVQASFTSFTSVTATGFTINFTAGTGGSGRIVLVKSGSAVNSDPVDGTSYTASTTFGSGTQIGTGNYVVYASTGTSVAVTGLTANTTYHIAVYEYSGSSTTINYLLTPSTGNRSTLVTAPTAASNLIIGTRTTSAINVSWTNGSGTGRIVVARASATTRVSPTGGTTYTANSSSFTDGLNPTTGTGNIVVYNGASSSVSVTGLSSATTYIFDIYEYDGTLTTTNYSTQLSSSSTSTLAAEPSVQASFTSFSSVTATGFTINFSAGTGGSGRIVLVKSTSAVDSDPIDGTSYTASSTFGSGTQIGTGNYVVYASNGTSVTVTGLTANTTYHVAVYEYNGSSTTINYLLSPSTSNRSTLVTAPTAASSVVVSNLNTTTATISWTNGSGSGRIVVARATATSNVSPTGGTEYIPSLEGNFTGSTTTGTNNIVIFNGSGNSVNVNNLSSGTAYTFLVYEYSGSSTTINYASAATGIGTTSFLTYYSQGNGDPATLSNYNSNRLGGGSTPSSLTTANLVIQSGHNLTTTGTLSFGATGALLQIENGGILTANHAITISSSATFQIDNGGTYIHNNAGTPSSTIFNGTESFAASSNFKINLWSSNTTVITTGVTLPYGNLELNWTANTQNWQQAFSGSVNLCSGNFIITSVGSGSIRLTASGTPSITVNGNFEINCSGTVDFGSSSNGATINLGGDLTQTAGTITTSGSGFGAITTNGTGSNTWTFSGGTRNYVTFTISSGKTITLATNFTLGTLSATGNILDISGTLIANDKIITAGPGPYTINLTGTLKTTNTTSAGALTGSTTSTINSTNSPTFTLNNGSTVEFNGSGAQFMNARTFSNLTINNASGVTLNASSNITVSGTLLVTNGALNVGANTLSISSSTSGSGAINFDNSSTFNFTGGSSITVTNPIALNSGTIIFNYPFGGGADPTFTGDISGSGNMNLTSDVSGRNLLLSGLKSFNGGITLVGTGSAKPNLRINNVGSLGSGTLTSTITVSNGGYLQTLANLSAGVSNNISISGAGHYLNVLADGSNHLLLSGIISGSGIVTKIGSATLTLTGANSYTGLTTVSDGTLQLNKVGGTTIPATNNVTVSGTGNLKVTTNQTLNDLSVASGTLTVDNGATLTINGTFTGGGTIVNNGKIIIKNNSTFPGATTTISSMNDLEIDRAGGVTLDKDLTISGVLTLTSGTLTTGSTNLSLGGSASAIIAAGSALNISGGTTDFNSRPVTFKSNSSSTARLSQVVGTLSNATNVTVERYIPAARKWRPVTAPLIGSSNNSIYYNWQNNGATPDGLTGVELWRPNGTGTDGFTINGNSTNILSYTGGSNGSNGGGYTQLTATNTPGSLFDATTPKAFLLFATGPYGSTNYLNSSTPIATTLKATGTLFQGNFDLTGLAAGYHLIPNPYPSAITFNPGTNMTVVNIPDIIYMWDPKISTVNSTGGYVTTNAGVSTPKGGAGSYSTDSRVIPNGAAFFIRVNDATTGEIHLTEACKATTGDFNIFGRGNANGQEVFRANILKPSAADVLTDGVATVFGTSYTATPSNEDAEKFNSPTEGIALRRVNKNYAIELRPYITANDTIFLRLLNMNQTNYKLELKAEYFDVNTTLQATLKDAYTNTSTPVSLATDTYYNFTVDANAASTGDRFMIVFKPSTTLPVNITSIKATQKASTVVVDWTVENEVNLKEYQVQKSVDGRNFETLATVKANNSKAYSSIDNAPSQGANYYRIVSISNDDKKQYSNIVLVKFGVKNSEVAVYPNPIKGNTINLQLQNIDKGDYELQVINTVGQVVFSKMINHNGGSATQTVQMPSNVAKGNYVLKLANKESILYSEKIILE